MQFLVITRQKTPAPPEMLMPMLSAMEAWLAQNRASGKATAMWGFAGTIGGGLLEVESHEELDAIMSRFPFAPFSTVEIIPLCAIEDSLNNAKAFVGEMLAGMASR